MFAWMLATAAFAGMPSKIKDRNDWAEDLWSINCRHCHGDRALGDGPLTAATEAPALAGKVAVDAAMVARIQDGHGKMPAFRDVVGRGDSWRVLEWLAALDPETGKLPGEEAKERKKAEKAAAAAREAEGEAEGEAGSDPESPAPPPDGDPPRPPPPPTPPPQVAPKGE